MRISAVRIKNFRRFTDLRVSGIGSSTRLIVLAGPNGVGKSSFFDGLQSWYRLAAWRTAYADAAYSSKLGTEDDSHFYDRETVELHGGDRTQQQLQAASIYLRTAYRHEVDFNVENLTRQQSPLLNGGRSRRAVDVDESVSENYQRLIWQTFSAVFDENTPESATKLEIRERLIGKIKMALNSVLPELTLTRVGGFGSGHSFEFSKGVSKGFPYINLSAGEKAVFDLILDAVVKAEFYQDALWSGFDAKCYRAVFKNTHPDVDFVSVGNSHDASSDKIGLTSALQTIASGTDVIKVRDRDIATDAEVAEWEKGGVRALNRRHIESYLFDVDVLEKFCDKIGRASEKSAILGIRTEAINRSVAERSKDRDDIKAASGDMYVQIRKHLSLTASGTTARAFALESLAPLLEPGMKAYDELCTSIFG